tara:strand:- start:10 stop:273 length:264 start_codon:yes stop_codon:yes gene_type:complete
MGGLFKKPKAPPPDPRVEENLREQELAAEQERIAAGKKLAAQARSRVRGGQKGLMAEGVTAGTLGRETGSATGTPLQATLGRNPRAG